MVSNKKGWHRESMRHREARLFGKASGGKVSAPKSVRSISKKRKTKTRSDSEMWREIDRAGWKNKTKAKEFVNKPFGWKAPKPKKKPRYVPILKNEKWKKQYSGAKPDGSKTISYETPSKYLNAFSDDGGKTYCVRVMNKTTDYEDHDSKTIFQKDYVGYANAEAKIKQIVNKKGKKGA